MASFADAVAQGFTYLETDVRLSADGVLVALHDSRLERVSEGRGAVAEHTAAALSRMRLRHPDGSLSEERIPMLEDLVHAFPAGRLNIDAKEPATVAPLGDAIERWELFERCCVGAFSDDRLNALRRRFGSVLCTALGPREVARVRAAGFGVPAAGRLVGRVAQVPVVAPLPVRLPWVRRRGPGVDRSAPPTATVRVPVVDRFFLAACRRAGVPVHVWTVNEASEMEALLDRGIDGFMTDRPSVAAAVLRRRGHWRS